MNGMVLLPPRLRERAGRLCAVMKDMIGVDATEGTRKRPVVIARMIVACALLEEGYTETAVGTVLGWDHSTINHYRRRMKEMLTAPGYDAERGLRERFRKMIDFHYPDKGGSDGIPF